MNIFLILAIACAFIFTLMGFDIISASHIYGWLGLALLFYFLAAVVPVVIPGTRRVVRE